MPPVRSAYRIMRLEINRWPTLIPLMLVLAAAARRSRGGRAPQDERVATEVARERESEKERDEREERYRGCSRLFLCFFLKTCRDQDNKSNNKILQTVDPPSLFLSQRILALPTSCSLCASEAEEETRPK